MVVLRRYRSPALSAGATQLAVQKIQDAAGDRVAVEQVNTELCFYFVSMTDLGEEDIGKLQWLINSPLEGTRVKDETLLQTADNNNTLLVEIGPRLNFSTPFSTNAVSICKSMGLPQVTRIECSTRYLITLRHQPDAAGDKSTLAEDVEISIVSALHDRMTECRYLQPIESFDLEITPEEVYEVDVIGQGKVALQKANTDLGLAFDDWDLDYYTKLFTEKVGRNPTSVECFDLAQSNSEHSRHWFFKGHMIVDGEEHEQSLFSMIMDTQTHSNKNNVIAFNDNSSGILGYRIDTLHPQEVGKATTFTEGSVDRDIIFTAETHNFPTGVAPFPGATTGTGGRIRDVHCTGTGAHVVAGTAGYSFGNLNIPGYKLPWEDTTFTYPSNFAPPMDIAIQASNGASDYGNKFGEPVLAGFARSFGQLLPDGNRREWVKPIMFSGGLGTLEHMHIKKEEAESGMEVVKIGGPVYRIGVGGGAASSIQVQGDNTEELDFGAVQRGDAEMEQKLNRVIRACIELREKNPVCSIHDQGAGGNGNVLKEICEPAGAVIRVKDFQLGDPTLSVLEIWGAEYQESNALLVRPEHKALLQKIGDRERCPVSFVGTITGDGKIRLEDEKRHNNTINGSEPAAKVQRAVHYPVDLQLEHVLGKMPRKVFHMDRAVPSLNCLKLPEGLTVEAALDRVLRLPSVASKRYLTNKVDRSVTGLVAQQQCVGPLHTPLADVAVTALSHFTTMGAATAIGEQPIKGLVDAACGARMSVAEALTNLVFARISDIKDVKCSGNWMWPAKLAGEGAALFDACTAMCDIMKKLGIAVDGGKDSLSMAARVGQQTVKAPGTLVVSVYAPCPDITATVTPDLKCPIGSGSLLYVPLTPGRHRLGGSALAQCYSQLGDTSPNLDDTDYFLSAFQVIQDSLKEKMLVSGHDVSDGGLVTCILEMAFAGNCGLEVNISAKEGVSAIEVLFAEELGWVLEVANTHREEIVKRFQTAGVTCCVIGQSIETNKVEVKVNSRIVLSAAMTDLRDTWEATSFQLERHQAAPSCVQQEAEGLKARSMPKYQLTFDPHLPSTDNNIKTDKQPSVAVIREEGSNGDREMVAAFHMAGFQVWDVNMQDLCSGQITLDHFSGIVFVGGFSYADVFGSAKGWGATLLYNEDVRRQFDVFYARSDTFSLGVCNGCQLMALLGWVGKVGTEDTSKTQNVHLAHNASERFESRFPTVRIEKSPAMMLQGMEGSVLGIWVAHGEGRMVFRDEATLQDLESSNLIPVKYTDDEGKPTMEYPLNPNGSPNGAAALCSQDGRHLAIMPHPERCVLPWQWPWMPYEWANTVKVSPWLRMFQNAYTWCTSS